MTRKLEKIIWITGKSFMTEEGKKVNPVPIGEAHMITFSPLKEEIQNRAQERLSSLMNKDESYEIANAYTAANGAKLDNDLYQIALNFYTI